MCGSCQAGSRWDRKPGSTGPRSRSQCPTTGKGRLTSPLRAYLASGLFASVYVKSHYLEVGLELLREAEHPQLRTAFATSKKVVMHRITLRDKVQFDDALRDLIREAMRRSDPGCAEPGPC